MSSPVPMVTLVKTLDVTRLVKVSKRTGMKKDKALEELFLAQKPHFADNADFMAALTKRLDAVEYLKKHQEATIRR